MTQKLRVLIVDNQVRARTSLKALLGAWHEIEEVREAANGIEAVQLAEEIQPDLILMDGRMPGINGFDATRLIKARWPRIRIIILSMYPEFEVEALSAGADAFVSKSELPDRLRETLGTFLTDQDKS
ncbi:MAG TPA: response regulator transcription factor [Anaerolineales bacterium]|nr:response regulator transcription factor [Anaerolineales bacterium]